MGKNLQDHFTVFLGPFVINQSLSFILERDFNLSTSENYFINRQGRDEGLRGLFCIFYSIQHFQISTKTKITYFRQALLQAQHQLEA